MGLDVILNLTVLITIVDGNSIKRLVKFCFMTPLRINGCIINTKVKTLLLMIIMTKLTLDLENSMIGI